MTQVIVQAGSAEVTMMVVNVLRQQFLHDFLRLVGYTRKIQDTLRAKRASERGHGESSLNRDSICAVEAVDLYTWSLVLANYSQPVIDI